MIELRKIDPAQNMRRYYRLSVEPTLFGEFALVREWGRVGTEAGRTKENWHASALDADAALADALKRRKRRGYVLERHAQHFFTDRQSVPVNLDDGEVRRSSP